MLGKPTDLAPQILMELPSNSGVIGQDQTQKMPQSAIGIGRGATGLTVAQNACGPMGDNPTATDRELVASLRRSHGLRLEWKTTFPDSGPVSLASVARLPAGRTAAELMPEIDAAMAPMRPAEIGSLLAQLRLLTKARPETEADLDGTATLLTERLMKYPADVVRHVLKTQPDVQTFWPSWNELRERLDLHSRTRRSIAQAIKNHAQKRPTPAKEPIKPDQLAAIMAKFRSQRSRSESALGIPITDAA